MAKAKRKDKKGNILRVGECCRASDGRYSYSYTDRQKQRHTVYAKNIVELREKEKQIQRDRIDGIDISAANRLTLNDMFDRYIKQKFNLKETTMANYLFVYNQYVRDTFGKRKLVDIKYSDVKMFYHSLIVDRGIAAVTVEHVHTLLHPTFKLAIRDGFLRTNPTDDVMTELKKSKIWVKKKRHALTIPQQRAFINFLATSTEYSGWLPIMTILLGTGMRIGECLGLRWEDVDFANRFISVNHNFTDRPVGRERKMGRHIQTPKTEAGTRIIPILDEVMDAFADEYQIQKTLGFCEEEIDGYSGFIFSNRDHKVYSAASVNNAMHRIIEAYNIEERENAKKENREPQLLPIFSAHVLRHTFCTRLCENESNLKVIQEIMGHKDIQTTIDIYADCTKEKKQEVMTNLTGKIIIR